MLIPKKGAIKVSLISPLLLTLNISYEYALSNTRSIQNGLAYTYYHRDDGHLKQTTFTNYQYTLDYRIYIRNRTKFHGWYHQPFLKYTYIDYQYYTTDSITYKFSNVEEKMQGISAGYVFGRQQVYNNKWLFDVFIGSYASFTIDYKDNREAGQKIPPESFKQNPFIRGIWFRPGLKVGYLF